MFDGQNPDNHNLHRFGESAIEKMLSRMRDSKSDVDKWRTACATTNPALTINRQVARNTLHLSGILKKLHILGLKFYFYGVLIGEIQKFLFGKANGKVIMTIPSTLDNSVLNF